MHKWLIAALCWLGASDNFFAQGKDTLIIPSNEWFIKASPLALLETDAGIGFSAEYVIPEYRLGIQVEWQPVFFDPYHGDDGNGLEEPRGVISSGMPLGIELRPEIRYYIDGLHAKPYHPHIITKADGSKVNHTEKSRAYVAVDVLCKRTWTQRLGNVNINNGGTQAAYLQKATYTDVKQVWGFDFKLGGVFTLFSANRWFLEPFFGIGIRFKTFHYKNLPVGASEPTRSVVGLPRRILETNDWQTGVSIPIGVKLVYKLH